MKITVLTDNNVLQSKNFLGEHGLSFYIEDGSRKIIFDTGYSDVYLQNAYKMGINLLNLDYIVFSHGHYDHTWGLAYYIPFYTTMLKQGFNYKKPTILAHPDTFNEKFEEDLGEIGTLTSVKKLSKNFEMLFTEEPFWLTENLVFLGEIPRKNDFEAKEPIGKILKGQVFEDDYITGDSAIVYKSRKGLVIISGCAHSGICNMVEYAKKVCGESKIHSIIGGFHLINPKDGLMKKTVDYLKTINLDEIYPCHCTSLKSKLILGQCLNLKEAGVGLVLEYQ